MLEVHPCSNGELTFSKERPQSLSRRTLKLCQRPRVRKHRREALACLQCQTFRKMLLINMNFDRCDGSDFNVDILAPLVLENTDCFEHFLRRRPCGSAS